MMNLHIHAPPITDIKVARGWCPVCDWRTYFVGWAQEWYGWHYTCLKCGDQWQDDEMLGRPFKPRWRQENKDAAKKLYRHIKKEATERSE